MAANQNPSKAEKEEQVLKELRREVNLRLQGYRDRALKLFPHICASCGREFPPKRLRELTVHHKDGNYKNNPADGSNWELLCLFCHDHEHERYKLSDYFGGTVPDDKKLAPSIFSPFENLDQLIKLDDSKTGTPENETAPDPDQGDDASLPPADCDSGIEQNE